jgi:uncharacterized membrane protein YbhN (UPF0104 family)
MKHLVAQEHHPHLKKRAILEIVGLLVLIGISFQQREMLQVALSAIKNSNVQFLFLTCLTYWLLLPLTSISYRLLSRRKVPLQSTMLAQLAGAGPGRVIPGGLGHLSISAMHLHHIGLSMQRALVLTVTNNLLGAFTNTLLVIIAIVIHPNLLVTITSNFSPLALLFTFGTLLVLASLILWLSHIRSTRKTVKRINVQTKSTFMSLLKRPKITLELIVIASIIALGHASILLLSGETLSVHITMVDALIALSAGVFIGGAIPTPGGIGAVEAGTISALVLLGYDTSVAASVALLFRVATYWQPLIPGTFAYIYLRNRELL